MGEKITRYILGFLGICLFVILVILGCQHKNENTEESVGMLTEWYYENQDGSQKEIVLPKKLTKDDEGNIVIYMELPEAFEKEQIICFWTYFQKVEVCLEQEKIYTFDDSESGSFGKAPTSCWNYVEIPEESDGKKLTIQMYTPYQEFSFRMEEVVYGNTEQLHCWMNNVFSTYRIIDNAFIWLGILFLILILIQKVEKRYKYYQIYYSTTLVMFSIYLRTCVRGIPVYWISDYFREMIGMLCLFLVSVPITFYIKNRVIRKPKMAAWCNIMAVTEVLSVLILFILQALGVRDVRESMGVAFVSLFLASITALICALYYFIKERKRISVLTVLSAFMLNIVIVAECTQFYFPAELPFENGMMSRIGILIIIGLESILYIYFLKGLSKKQQLMEAENQNLQIHILTSHIRPHFILNTLGAIRTMIKKDADQAYDLLYDFSKYIRNNLEQKDYSKKIPFLEELDYIETYLKLEKARLGERLRVEYDIHVKSFMILPLTIQPFVENAVKHGIFPLKHGGVVRIITRATEQGVLIEVQDNGVGFDTKDFKYGMESGKSIGMKSAIFRLEEKMNGKCTVISSTTPGNSGTIIRIELAEKGVSL